MAPFRERWTWPCNTGITRSLRSYGGFGRDKKEEKAFGEYRTRRLVLEAWDRQQQ